MPRTTIPLSVRQQVLIEAGYRCAVPTCRNILALDLHHIEEVQEGGGNEPSNLIALCPTCHALFTRGTISRDAINAWKLMLVSLSHAFDKETIDNLLFLKIVPPNTLAISGDGVLKFSALISTGLATFQLTMQNGPIVLYRVFLTPQGEQMIDAWYSGDRNRVERALDNSGGA